MTTDADGTMTLEDAMEQEKARAFGAEVPITLGMSAKEVLDSGLLWEINRVVLNPLGLAMAVYTDEYGNSMFLNHLVKTDAAQGFLMTEEAFNEGDAKFTKFCEGKSLAARMRLLPESKKGVQTRGI